MPNRDNPCGFTPVSMLDGSEVPCYDFLATTLATALFVGDMVSAQAAGDIEPAAAGDGDIVLGAVVGLYDTNGVPVGHPNSDIATKYLAVGDSGIAKVALALPSAVFKVQCLSGATPAATDVFMASDHTAGAGSTTTARSAHELTATFAAANQFKVIGRFVDPSNAWGEHVDVLVVASESYWSAGTNGV